MSSKKNSQSKKTPSSKNKVQKGGNHGTPSVTSLFRKQRESKSRNPKPIAGDKLLVIDDDDDDDFRIEQSGFKSKYFSSKAPSKIRKNSEGDTSDTVELKLSKRLSTGRKRTTWSGKDLKNLKILNGKEDETRCLDPEEDMETNASFSEDQGNSSSRKSDLFVTVSSNKSETSVSSSPSKKLSLLRRRSQRISDAKDRNKLIGQNSLKDGQGDPAVIILQDSDSSDFSDGEDFKPKKRKLATSTLMSVKKSKSLATSLRKCETGEDKVSTEVDTKESSGDAKAKCVSSLSRENSKLLWQELFQKKVDDKPDEADKAEESETNASSRVDATDEKKETEGNGTDITGDVTSKATIAETNEESTSVEAGNEEVKYRIPYYLENFQTVMTAVLSDEDNYRLFDDEDLAWIETFNKMSENGQKLYVRLFSRKLAWLPISKISYPGISNDLTDVLQELVDKGLAVSESDLVDLEQTLKVMSASDLKLLAKSFHINSSGLSKPQLSEALLKKSKQSTVISMFGGGKTSEKAMLERAKKLLGRSFRLLEEPRRVFVRMLMLFSVIHSSVEEEQGNGGQPQLYQMLLVNMGKVVYPQFTVNKQTCLIKDRESLFRFEHAMQLDNDMAVCIDKNNWAGAYSVYLEAKEEFDKLIKDEELVSFDNSLPSFLRSCTAGSVLTRVLNQGIEILQRRKDYPAAVALIQELLGQDVYCRDYRGYWWERLALNKEMHLKQPAEALVAIGEGLADLNVKVGHRLALYLRAEKLCTSPNSKFRHRMKEFVHEDVLEAPKQTLEARVLPHSVPGLRFSFMTEDSYINGNAEDVTVCAVEEIVLQHYNRTGYPHGLHAEGSIISILFNLYFWDICFMDVPDAFHSPYQSHPLDFQSDWFYIRRKDAIDDRLQELEQASEERLHEMMAETWNNHNGERCAGISWEKFNSLEHAQGLVSCIQGKILSGMMRRYATNPRHTRSGFPDLTLWNTDNKTFKICEVKGPGDRLSHKQILWLDYLLKLGVDAEVCYVKAVGAKKLKPVAGTSCE